MKASRVRLSVLVLLLTAIGWPPASGEQPNVLLLYPESFYRPATIRFDNWFRCFLKQRVERVNFEVIIVGTNLSDPSPSEAVWDAQRTLIERHCSSYAVELIVLASPNMLRNLVQSGLTSFNNIPLLAFGSIPEDTKEKLSALHEVDFKYDPALTLQLARQLQPELRKVVLIYGNAPLDFEMAKNVREGLLADSGGLEIEELSGLTMAEYEKVLSSLPDDRCVLLSTVINDSSGERFSTEEAVGRIARASRVPVYSAMSTQLGNGAIGGGFWSYKAMAFVAAELSEKLLKGDPVPASMSYPMEQASRKSVDYRALKRWGLDPKLVPAGFEVINRPPSIWATHRKATVLALLAMALLAGFVVVLLHQNRRIHRTKKLLSRERKQLQATQDQLRLLAKVLLAADEEEYLFIARELHDDISQRVTALALELASFEQRLEAGGWADMGKEIGVLRKRHVALAHSLHALSRRLHPTFVTELGLKSALKSTVDEMAIHYGMQIDYYCDFEHDDLPEALALTVLRVVQQALINVIKHARTKKAKIFLRQVASELELVVEDEGVGFDPEAGSGGGIGLISMRERVLSHGGKWDIFSAPDAGTSIRASIPIP